MPPVSTITPAQALNKAKIRLMSTPDSAFFTTVCFSLKHIWDESIPTAATNGKEIRFNPNFFMSLNTDEQVFLLLHESMHVAYQHMNRRMEREHRKWNAAGDYVINQHLVDRGFKMPSIGLYDPMYRDMSTEQVYDALPVNQDCPMMDILEDAGIEPDTLQREIEDILVRAEIQSKLENDRPGTIPGEIEIFLNGLLNPKLPWNRILQKYLNTFNKNDYTFKKFNRRYFPKFILPGLRSENLMDIAVAVDTSGSVSDEEFQVFITEIHSIFRMMKPEKISLLQFDTCLRSVDEIRSLADMSKVKFTGRGGTQIQQVLEWIDANKPQLTLCFTDGDFYFRGRNTKQEMIWLIHNSPNWEAPFGKTIHYDI